MSNKSPSTKIDRRLAARMELTNAWRGAYYCQAIQRLRPQAGSQVLEVADGLALFSGLAFPINATIGLGMVAPVQEQHFQIIERFYANLGAPARIHHCLLADRSLSRLLEQRGFRLECMYAMFAYLLPGNLDALESPAGVTVTRANEEQADLWIRTTAQGFSEEEEPTQTILDVLSGNFFARNASCFLAWVDGQPAGGGGLYIHAEAAELGGASTRHQFRRRGVHAALLKRRLEAAYAAGCDLAMAQTSPSAASNKNIRRQGFQQAYYKVVFVLDKENNHSDP